MLGTLSVATVVAVLQAPTTDTADSTAEAATKASPAPIMSTAEYAEVTRLTKNLDAIAHRQKVAKVRAAALVRARAAAAVRATRSAQRNARPVGAQLAATRYGWIGSQFSCLDQLWTRESNWHYYADNPSSSAYGIAQALPGAKMSSAGPDWATNPVTQILWGLGYIKSRYGTPCGAWSHETSAGWY